MKAKFKKGDFVSTCGCKHYGIIIEAYEDDQRWEDSTLYAKVYWADGTFTEERIPDLVLEAKAR